MTARRYRYSASLSWGGDEPTAELEVEVEYSVAWGSPPSRHFGTPDDYDPGSASVVEDIKLLTVEGKPRPWDMGCGFLTDDAFEEDVRFKLDDHEEAMILAATETEAGDYEAAEEAKWEERRLEQDR